MWHYCWQQSALWPVLFQPAFRDVLCPPGQRLGLAATRYISSYYAEYCSCGWNFPQTKWRCIPGWRDVRRISCFALNWSLSLCVSAYRKIKVQVNVDCRPIAPRREHTSKALRYGTRSQGISQFYLHTPRSSANGMNHTCLWQKTRAFVVNRKYVSKTRCYLMLQWYCQSRDVVHAVNNETWVDHFEQ